MGRMSKAGLVARMMAGGAVAWLAVAGAQEKARFEPRPASTYPARQTIDNVTIAVEPHEGREKIKQAFGKVDLAKLGFLPILVVIANDSERVVQLESMRVQLITGDGQKVDPVPAEEVQRSGPVKRPDLRPKSPFPGIKRGSSDPKPAWEIEARAFIAPLVPARSSAHGFFYFRLGKGPDRLTGSKLYITRLQDARTAKDLLYFEVGLDEYVKAK